MEVEFEWLEIMQGEWTLISVDCYGGPKQLNIKFIPTLAPMADGSGHAWTG